MDFIGVANQSATLKAGFRTGDKGTHTSRTMMLDELRSVLSSTPTNARRAEITVSIVDENSLAKPTLSTRRLSDQRLGELYALDAEVPLFRILRRLWNIDHDGRPLLALLASLARDPLLRASAAAIVSLPIGAEFNRAAVTAAVRAVVGDRLSDATLAKVVRNVASTWEQSGHLKGRTFKHRQRVAPTAAVVAFALYLATTAGFLGEHAVSSSWITMLDVEPSRAQALATEAKRLGLIDLQVGGDVFALDVRRIDPWRERT